MIVNASRRAWLLSSGILLLVTSLRAADVRAENTELRVAPQQVRLASRHHRQQLLVTGRNARGVDVDHTRGSQFRSENPAVASVSSSGLINAVSSGQTTVHVRFDDRELHVPVRIGTTATEPRVSFRNEVMPILTRLGCNSGGCHGKSTGQNGFRLSLLGFEPELDFTALVRESRGRRVSSSQPAQSLLLTKATGRVPHGGGRRVDLESDYYRILHKWMSQGVRGPRHDDRVVDRISIQPKQRVLSSQAQQQLLVTAHFSDGERRDVTRSVVYQTNSPEISEVSQDGLVATHDSGGLFAVLVRFGDKMDVFRGTVPFEIEAQQPTTAESAP
ncbi:MAG: Ig-like domain-containing protein, partial [Planctomycetaceae bacterium]